MIKSRYLSAALVCLTLMLPPVEIAFAQTPLLHGLDGPTVGASPESQPVQGQLQIKTSLQPTSVESLFDLPKPQNSLPAQNSKKQHQHGFVWHAMDNIGIPMFGNHDPDLAPEIRSAPVMPALSKDSVITIGSGTSNSVTGAKYRQTIIDDQGGALDPTKMSVESNVDTKSDDPK